MFENTYSNYERILMRFGLFTFRITLDFMYMYILKKEYINIPLLLSGYERGAFTFSVTPTRIIMSYLLTLLFIEFVMRFIVRNDRPHELICISLLAISVFPNLTMFSYSEIEWGFVLWLTLFWIACFAIMHLFMKKPANSIETKLWSKLHFLSDKKIAQYIFWIIVLLFVVGSIAFAYFFHGRFYINLSFNPEDVYESRLSARGTIGTVFNYFRNTSMYTIIPILLNAFLRKKKYGLFGICLLTLLLLYSIDSQKAVLMLAVVSIIGAFIVNKKAAKTIIMGFLFVNVFVILFYLATGNLLLIDYLVKRIYFIPAIISKCYYEYIGIHGNLVFLSSFFQSMNLISNYAYKELSLPFQIGKYYFGSSSISANTGGFAGAYAYGVIGMIIVPIVYGYLFKLLDRLYPSMEIKYYFPFIVISAYTIVGTTLPSVILVYGLVIGLFLLYVMNNSGLFERNESTQKRFLFRRKS